MPSPYSSFPNSFCYRVPDDLSVGVGALDDPTAKRQSTGICRKMLRLFRRDVEDAVPYG